MAPGELGDQRRRCAGINSELAIERLQLGFREIE